MQPFQKSHRPECSRKSLDINPVNRYDENAFPLMSEPRAVGYFSVSTNRQYEPTAEQLRYFRQPPVDRFPLDLNAGINVSRRKPDSAYDEKLDHMLRWIYDHHTKVFRQQPLPEFVCYRGLLRLIMCTPYERRQSWCIHASRYKGTIYLCKRDLEEDQFKRNHSTRRELTMCSWGFKFEQFCLADAPDSEPITSVPVDECAEFSCVFRTSVGGIDLFYAAEMDGVISTERLHLEKDENLRKVRFIELKVCQLSNSPRLQQSFRTYKTRNWWCQAFLVGIKDLFVGNRNEEGLVRQVNHMEVRSLPKQAYGWTPVTCLTFLIKFLERVKAVMENVNCPYTTYEFCFHPTDLSITYDCIEDKSVYSFLPDWYIGLVEREHRPLPL